MTVKVSSRVNVVSRWLRIEVSNGMTQYQIRRNISRRLKYVFPDLIDWLRELLGERYNRDSIGRLVNLLFEMNLQHAGFRFRYRVEVRYFEHRRRGFQARTETVENPVVKKSERP